jgi:uncharacterized protein YidB (DUF937 family)
MGLLDDLIGQLAGGSPQRPGTPARQVGGGADMSTVLIALAPVVIAMLRGNQRQTGGAGLGGGGGALGDVLGGLLGGGRGGSAAGGLGGLLVQFQRAGFGTQAGSWVGTGQNQALPLGALEQVFGRGGLAEIARMAGVSEDDASRGLAQLLPEMVDRVTPNGQVPDGDSLTANLSDLSRRLGGA